jgi:hypothetical protein
MEAFLIAGIAIIFARPCFLLEDQSAVRSEEALEKERQRTVP